MPVSDIGYEIRVIERGAEPQVDIVSLRSQECYNDASSPLERRSKLNGLPRGVFFLASPSVVLGQSSVLGRRLRQTISYDPRRPSPHRDSRGGPDGNVNCEYPTIVI